MLKSRYVVVTGCLALVQQVIVEKAERSDIPDIDKKKYVLAQASCEKSLEANMTQSHWLASYRLSTLEPMQVPGAF